MSASIAYRVLFVIPSALPVIPSEVEESLHHRPEGRALRPFIWGHDGAGSSSASTSPEGVISIGGSSLSQDPGENPLKYVMENCPLWGQDNRVDKKERPRFKMKYLYSVVALKIVNERLSVVRSAIWTTD